MDIIRYYEIVIKTYHGEPVGRLRFERNGTPEESALYSIPELNNLILLLEQGAGLGSFAIGCQLEKGARFTLCTE